MSSLVLKVNVSSVEQIRRSLRAKLKGVARLVCMVLFKEAVIVLREPTYPTD